MKKSKVIKQEGVENDENSFWAEGSYAETMSSNERNIKMKTFHMKHDEDMNFNCKKCKAGISAHNKDWHAGMCDDCFNKKYFPDVKRNTG